MHQVSPGLQLKSFSVCVCEGEREIVCVCMCVVSCCVSVDSKLIDVLYICYVGNLYLIFHSSFFTSLFKICFEFMWRVIRKHSALALLY